MCGIAGILALNHDPVDPDVLRQMARSIRHRGPDDEGVYCENGVGLANVRLAILDLTSHGHQPMRSADGRYTLVYNGEIYNFRELAAALESEGAVFESRCDTEVLLRAWERWGSDCVLRLNGMFAFAIWDARERELTLARDRFGIKPLYYKHDGQRLVFSSEIKGILAAGCRAAPDLAAVSEYFTFQNIFSDRTLFDGVRLLPAGHMLRVSADGRSDVDQYWDLRLEPDEDLSEEAWVALVRDAFQRAVTRQLVSDVQVGSYLSGGMDSASIAAIAGGAIPRLMTFTGGFDMRSVTGFEVVFDERADAEAMASSLRTEHYEMILHAGDMAWVMPELIWHLEDLRVGMSYQNYFISRLASKFVKVVLAGTGGDELFGGYPWRYDVVASLEGDAFERAHYDYWTRLLGDDQKSEFFTGALREACSDSSPRASYQAVLEATDGLDPVSRAQYFEVKTFLHGLLVVEDRVSMAHSLESRVPFLDDDLVDIARRVPSRLKYRGGEGKPLLRSAMRGILPDEIVQKPKQGFSPPDEAWYRGHSMAYIEKLLLDERTLSRGYFEPDQVRRVLHEHFGSHVNHRLLIWSLIAFEWWNRLFLDGETPSDHQAPVSTRSGASTR